MFASRLVRTCLLNRVIQNELNSPCYKTNPTWNGYGNPSCRTFYEFSPKGGYENRGDKKRPPKMEQLRFGLRELKKEIQVWSDEIKDRLAVDPVMAAPQPGEIDTLWVFNSATDFNNWVVTCDQDHNEGFSSCSLGVSPVGKGLFSGVLSTQVPKDGRIRYSGYCNMKSIRPQKSFKRDTCYDWGMYTHLVIRLRGDGRSYMLNIATAGYFDLTWNDQFHFPLYTRGGPHWQVSRIPFSKFFMASKGHVQDQQCPLPLYKVTGFGITAADKLNGPFRLELDYIGLEYDPSFTEEFAYEQYRVPAFYGGY